MGEQEASRAKVLVAFAAVYLIWGSTYLAIRFALDTMPPLLLTGARHFTAGVALYLFARLRKGPRPKLRQWPSAFLLGGLLLVAGNGGVVLAEQRVPTGIAALLVATVPLWMVGLDWLWKGGGRPAPQVIAGLVLGLIGIGVLTGPGSFGGSIDRVGLVILLVGALCWATGSLQSRRSPLPPGMVGVSMEMLAAGVILFVASAVRGEWHSLQLSAVSLKSFFGLSYLIVFGSLGGFTAYNWLLAHVPAAKASTYAFVNPVVAVFLGWLVLGEALTPRLLIASAVILGAVVLITTSRKKLVVAAREPAPPGVEPREAEG